MGRWLKRKRKKKTLFRRSHHYLFLVGAGILLLCFLSYKFVETLRTKNQSTSAASNSRWEVSVVMRNLSSRNESFSTDELSRYVLRELSRSNEPNFVALAEKLQRKTSAARINILRNETEKLLVQVSFHVPIFRIEAGRIRYVSRDFKIYGEASDEQSAKTLPLLKGFFEKSDKRLNLSSSQSPVLTQSERAILEKTHMLVKLLSKESQHFDQLIYDHHRGFSVVSDQLEVLIGMEQFETRLGHYRRIIKDAQRHDKKLSRIELDYDGKAFVKEATNTTL